jgi:hypothetical protein
VKNKQNRKDLQLNFIKIGGFFFKLAEQVDGFTLKCIFYFKLLSLKMYEIQQITLPGEKREKKKKSIPAISGYCGI